MIQKEFYLAREDGVNLYKSYSDQNFMIIQDQTGIVYDQAIDVEDSSYTYTETDTPIPTNEEHSVELHRHTPREK